MRVEEEENVYRLIFEGEGEELLAAGLSALASEMTETESALVESMLEEVTITDFNYEAEIDKETYYMTGLDMNLDMEMNMEGMQSEVSQSIQMTIHNFNGVETITVPADVIETAVPIDSLMEQEEGGELADTATNNVMFALAGFILVAAGGGLLLIRRKQLFNQV